MSLSALSVQSGSSLAVSMFSSISPMGAVFVRTINGAVLLTLFILVQRQWFRRSDLPIALAFGVTAAVMNAAFYQAIARMPLGDTVAVEFVGPIVVAIATSRRRRELIWVALALAGVVAITRRSAGPLNGVGMIFALTAGIAWGTYAIVGKRLATRGRREESLALGLWISSAILILPAILSSGSGLVEPTVLTRGVLLGFLASALPYSLELTAVGKVSITTFGVLLSLQPFAAAAAGLVYLHQGVGTAELIGFLCISLASAGVTVTSRPQKQESLAQLAAAEISSG